MREVRELTKEKMMELKGLEKPDVFRLHHDQRFY